MSHSHGGESEGLECQVEMLWNWNTIGSCILADTWYIRTEGMMVASVIGSALLATVLELCRRAGREYDAILTSQARHSVEAASAAAAAHGFARPLQTTVTIRASPFQQLVRALIHALTFSVAYIVMLIVMSFNGYIIIAVFVGAGFGKFLTDWHQVTVSVAGWTEEKNERGTAQDATICCG